MGIIEAALDHACHDVLSPGHYLFSGMPMSHLHTEGFPEEAASDRIEIAPEPFALDYVTVAHIEDPNAWYRDPVDHMAFAARVLANLPDGRVDLVYYRGNTPVLVQGVPVKQYGLGCCWPMDVKPGL